MSTLAAFSWMDPATPMGFAAVTVLKASLLLLLAAGLTSVLGRGSAALRHFLWTLAIGGSLALPVLSASLPWRWPVLPAGLTAPMETEASPPPSLASEPVRSGGGVEVGAAAPAPPRERRGSAELSPPSAAPTSDMVSASTASAPDLPWGALLALAWAAVAALLILHQLVGRLALAALARGAERVADPRQVETFERLVAAFGVERRVRLLLSDRTRVPMTWGLFFPVILLPRDAREWSDERLRLVLQHELAHVSRWDALTQALGRLVCAFYWFNPLAWWAAERMRSESELASDDCVLRRGERPSDYAGHLLELVTQVGRQPAPVGALPLAHRSRFEGRLIAILEPARAREAVRSGTALTLSAVVMGTVVLLAAVAPARAAEGPATEQVARPSGVSDQGSSMDKGTSPLPPSAEEAEPAPPAQEPESVEAILQAEGGEAIREEPAPSRSWVSVARGVIAELVENRKQEVGPDAVAALARSLREDENAEVRRTAAWALGQIESREATDALVQALREDADVEVRRTAVWALGQIEDPASAAALGEALSDSDAEVRKTALWALGQIESPEAVAPLSQALTDGDAEVRKTAAWALGQIESREAIGPLSQVLDDTDEGVREQAVWALGQIEAEEAVEPLVRALSDASPAVRRQAAWALGQIESERAVDGLSAALTGDEDARVREQAAWALGQIESEEATPALTRALSDTSAEVVTQAAWAIGQIEPATVPPELLDLLRNGADQAKEMALWAIMQIEDPSAVPALTEAIRDQDGRVRVAALQALGRIGDQTAIQAITELLQDSTPEVRAAAARALAGGRGGPSPRPRPRPQPRPRPRPRPNGG